ncbi:MAG: response regulator, partial [Rhodospirillales bacterium]
MNYLGEGTDALKLARILVVDDNPSNVTLISQILQSDGYLNIASTTDPREAVDMFCDGQFDLLLLDIRMPHLDGFEVMAALRLRIRDDFLPILVLTAQTDEETCFRALSSGAQDFLTKPI